MPMSAALCNFMEPDIYKKIQQDFGEKASVILALLKSLDVKIKGPTSKRVIRAILYLANGDLTILHIKVKQAKVDYRDIFMQAEYGGAENQRERDFSKTFYELGIIEESKP